MCTCMNVLPGVAHSLHVLVGFDYVSAYKMLCMQCHHVTCCPVNHMTILVMCPTCVSFILLFFFQEWKSPSLLIDDVSVPLQMCMLEIYTHTCMHNIVDIVMGCYIRSLQKLLSTIGIISSSLQGLPVAW